MISRLHCACAIEVMQSTAKGGKRMNNSWQYEVNYSEIE
jgi:hypothetical protein